MKNINILMVILFSLALEAQDQVAFDLTSNGNLVATFPLSNVDEESQAVCIDMISNGFAIEFPPNSNASFSAEIPMTGTIENKPFDLSRGRSNNPWIEFPNGGIVRGNISIINGKRFENVVIRGNTTPSRLNYSLIKKNQMKQKIKN